MDSSIGSMSEEKGRILIFNSFVNKQQLFISFEILFMGKGNGRYAASLSGSSYLLPSGFMTIMYWLNPSFLLFLYFRIFLFLN